MNDAIQDTQAPTATGTEQPRNPDLVSILMVNWNDRRFLDGSLGSIRQKVTVPYEIVLLNNGSEDDSIAFVEREFPEVRIVHAGANLGFIRGTNMAAKHAKGEYFFLLNPDTILQTDIAPALRLLQTDPSVGAVGASMYSGDGRLLANCGRFPSLLRLALVKSMFWRPYRGPYGPNEFGAHRVDWVEGSWMLTRAAAWEKVGGLDDRLFLYSDDLHYCRSLKEIGLVSVHMPSLAYTHFVGFSLQRLPYLYTGFRWFHTKFSGRTRRQLADIVMKLGLYVRVLIYGALALLLRKAKYKERQKAMLRVLDLWEQTAVPGARFH